jgi:hypothetical protein
VACWAKLEITLLSIPNHSRCGARVMISSDSSSHTFDNRVSAELACTKETIAHFSKRYREECMSSFVPMKRWQGFAVLLLLTTQVPAFAEGIDLQNTRSFEGGPINRNTVNDLKVKWVYQTAPDTGTVNNGWRSGVGGN